MAFSIDISLLSTSPSNNKILSIEYYKSSENDQLTVESLFNPEYGKDSIEIDYPIDKVCRYMISNKIKYEFFTS